MNQWNVGRNKRLKVAQFANPPKGETVAQKRLDIRIKDHATIKGTNASGYHKPGSMQGPR